MKLKKCFIICWYGSWPVYFQLYLNSCSYNKDWNWIIITDANFEEYSIPDNVEMIYKTLVELKVLFEKKLSIKIDDLKPYKLCDFKPLYGLIFEEYLNRYDYWGFCDIDLIWGKLSFFFPDQMINEYDKFLTKGHMTLFKNTEENRYLFSKEVSKYVNYKIILSSKYNWGFDEIGRFSIDKIVNKDPCYKCYRNSNDIADIFPYHDCMCIKGDKGIQEIQYAVFNGGGVYIKYKEIEDLIEKAYIHLQKRKIYNYDVANENYFYIFDNEIVDDMRKRENLVEVRTPPNWIYLRVNQIHRLCEIIKYNLWVQLRKERKDLMN